MEDNKPLDTDTISNTTAADHYLDALAEADKLIDRAEEEQDDHTDYSGLDKAAILAKAEEMLHASDVKKASDILQKLKLAMEAIETDERPAQIKAWTEAGNDPREFKASAGESLVSLNKTIQKFREKREEERRRAEEEKVANLRKKEQVLEKMKGLVETEENENSLKMMRELMREWREIRHVPKEFQQDLYDRYRFYVDKFYDNLTIFQELKEMDRGKNLEQRIELIKKVEALKEEKNIRKALVTLHKYHEDWRNTGPVQKEISDEIWQRFKSASDSVIAEKKQLQEQLDSIKNENLKLKELLVEKAEAAIAVLPAKLKDWGTVAKELDGFMEEWKKIGPVPTEVNHDIWTKFRAIRQSFFNARKDFFKELNSSREDNLAKKVALCEAAEKLKDAEEFNNTSDALNKLQEEWKKIGPVPEAKNDSIWKRFRAAFDHFYARKNAFYEQRRTQESEAVKLKEAIIVELEGLKEMEDSKEVFNRLKDAQMRWVKAGFVSGKIYHNLQKRYQEISDLLFAKFKRSSDEMKENVMKEHYDMLSAAPDGRQKMQMEERKLRDRIQKLRDEKSTIDNNLSFFAHAKNADAIRKQFESNIQKLDSQIQRLEKELKVIRSYRNNNA